MKISRMCIPCMARQAIEIAEEITQDEGLQEEIIRCSLREISEINFEETSPEVAFRMHQHAKRIAGVQDPYARLKVEYNEIAETLYNRIEEENWIENAQDPFDLACRLAIAGNIIDFSVGMNLEASDVIRSVEDSIRHPLHGIETSVLKAAAEQANHILYLADNAGEIVFDKFLLMQLPMDKVTYVVKGAPIVNDATMTDAIDSGVSQLVRVIDNGHDAQGTVLKACSEAFRREFDQADLVISKGQANFETLSDVKGKNMFHLLRAKCPAIANEIGCEHMAYVLTRIYG